MLSFTFSACLMHRCEIGFKAFRRRRELRCKCTIFSFFLNFNYKILPFQVFTLVSGHGVRILFRVVRFIIARGVATGRSVVFAQSKRSGIQPYPRGKKAKFFEDLFNSFLYLDDPVPSLSPCSSLRGVSGKYSLF